MATNMEKRYSAKQLLHHPWLKNVGLQIFPKVDEEYQIKVL